MVAAAAYYKFDVGQLPDELFNEKVPVEKWLKTTTTVGVEGFPANSLNKLSPISWDVELERVFGIALYMASNVLPFLLPTLSVLAWFFITAKFVLYFVVAYVGVLFLVENFFFKPRFLRQYNRKDAMSDNIKDNQYLFTERNITKYLSVNFVWPKSMHRPAMASTPMIFCAVPHGVAPFGITAYPLWSKLFNDKLCHWTCAPVVLKLPVVGYYMKKIGYVPAKSKYILETLTKKEENVGVVLDGISGMFQGGKNQEVAYLKARKGIVKIALRAGAPIVPVYGFGHTSLYTVVVDPFGILQWLSNALETSLTPFFGRYGWFLGPPPRHPVTVCIGEPVMCPQIAEPTKEDIAKYHQQMLDSYQQLFDKHKDAYGWGHKSLKFV
jgi:1-acyl-sn-glycerol-3-phosphate acyltransferase